MLHSSLEFLLDLNFTFYGILYIDYNSGGNITLLYLTTNSNVHRQKQT